jgi:ABC-2 type transport system ATP-binding protein
MIQTINLTKRYGNLMALSNLNLEIEEGDCFGFIGPNGAGKTTSIKILSTLLKPTWGEARIDGLSVGPVNARRVRSVIGYVQDYFGSYEDMVVQEYLEFFAASYNIQGDKRKQVIGDVLDLTDLSYKIDAEVNSLSRGMQQRLSVARVLLHDPKVLLLDEPASGLDPRARIEMRELLKELHRMGKTILISSHILLELADLCNHVGIIEQGELKYNGTMQDILDRARSGGGGAVLHVAVAERTEQAAQLIRQLQGVKEAQITNAHIRVTLDASPTPGDPATPVPASHADPARIAHKLVTEGFALTRLEEEKVNLETAFMRLTKGLVQ